MSLAVINSCQLLGFKLQHIHVEVHIGAGLPAFHIVGLPDTSLRESRERVRSAILSSGFEFPAARITVNLSPADFPKASGRFDLPIAIGILAASGQISLKENNQFKAPKLSHLFFVGELSLTGALLPAPGCLAIALGLSKEILNTVKHTYKSQTGHELAETHNETFCELSSISAKFLTGSRLKYDKHSQLILPDKSARKLSAFPWLSILGAQSLACVVAYLQGRQTLLNAPQVNLLENTNSEASSENHICLSDVRGQALACQALEIAASGGHSLLMVGSPGVGKSMLARRMNTILPALNYLQQLEVLAINELCGNERVWPARRPFRSPHHSSTRAALIGGGLRPQPGVISLAHHGVLFLDELAEFNREAIEALREPLECGQVLISRTAYRFEFPARFQLIAAMNPCPCGYWVHSEKPCICSTHARQRYLDKVSGPILDRVDMIISLRAEQTNFFDLPPAPTSNLVRQRVIKTQQRQMQRQGCLNAYLTAQQINQYISLDTQSQQVLQKAVQRWHWSPRVILRIKKIARTLPDMQYLEKVKKKHILAATQLKHPMQND